MNEWGEKLQKTFGRPLKSWHSNFTSSENEFLIQLPARQAVNLVVLEEALQEGQFIREYLLEAKIENQWHSIASGQSIGRKRIQSFKTVETDQVRLSVKGDENQLKLKNFRIYFQND